MLLALALIPVIGLLLFIYFNDKKEKEPLGLLAGLFFAGVGSTIVASTAEEIGMLFLDVVFPYESYIKSVILACIIVGPAEELAKFLVMRLITWKNKHFNYSYDAIVYAVFVSLGFAGLENIGYVFKSGIGTAIGRMFTAVPGHACYAVFMGYFYSRAKYASLTKNKKAYLKYITLTILSPIAIHGVYDAFLMGARSTDADLVVGLSLIAWLIFVIALFIVSCVIIIRSSKKDFCIVTLPDHVQTVYRPAIVGDWTCTCGATNHLNFCTKCGSQRPSVTAWTCPKCGTLATLKFCGNCGCPRPAAPAPATSAPSAAPSGQVPVQPGRPVAPQQYAQPPVQQPRPMQPQQGRPVAPQQYGQAPVQQPRPMVPHQAAPQQYGQAPVPQQYGQTPVQQPRPMQQAGPMQPQQYGQAPVQ
ncbi:MAG: PrsW family intramembrane metalloprotease, partial [Clostridiales bacterium]|nr:PrsW family intramembrane metalloprotease [Clostridiales bacterium]